MNKDQVVGKTKEIAGKVQETTGDIIGSPSQQVKGMAKQVEGKVQKGLGDARDVAEDAADEVVKRTS
jgi:uncharacterized protein YjbJ (UPF0337 family)